MALFDSLLGLAAHCDYIDKPISFLGLATFPIAILYIDILISFQELMLNILQNVRM